MSAVTAPALIARYASHTLDCVVKASRDRHNRLGNVYTGAGWMREEACTCGLRALLASNGVDERLLGEAEKSKS